MTTVEAYYKTWGPTLQHRKPTLERWEIAMRKHVLPALGDRALADVHASDLTKLFVKLTGNGMAHSTAVTTMKPIKAMLSQAAYERLIPDVGKVRVPKAPAGKKVRAMDADQLAEFFAALDHKHDLFYRTLLGTGMRISEALGLRWSSVGADWLTIERRWASECEDKPKNGETRMVPLAPGLSAALSAVRKDAGLVFPRPGGGHWSDVVLARSTLFPARERAGLQWVTFHTFRHTYASHAYKHGVPLGELSAYLGHATPQFTWTQYVHLFEADKPSMDWADSLV